MTTTVYINHVQRDDLRVNRIRASYVSPWEAELFYPGRHDAALAVQLWDSVVIEDGSSVVRFRGSVTSVRPGGVAGEGITFVCQDARFRLENEPVRINGRGSYVWNQRGSTCSEGRAGYDGPSADGSRWTCGQIIVDILEHALGVPPGGSGIPGHHGGACCVPDAYLTGADVAGYSAADILALDSICGEFSVDNTPIGQAISLLLGLNGGFYGWYLDPATGNLVVVNLDTLPATDLEAGELGEWQDKAGTDYRLLDNQLEWSLDGVCSTIIIQGADATAEEQPANIEGSNDPGAGTLGRLEMIAAPWLGWPAAYRALCQPGRLPTGKQIDMANQFTPPAGFMGWTHDPRVYVGTVNGPKYVYRPSSGVQPVWNLVTGAIMFFEDPRGVMGPYEKLWGWYWARVPFTVSAGPDGDAYDCFGYECARTVCDASLRDLTSYPYAAFSDADKVAMGILAQRLLRQYCDVRRQGTLGLDRADFTTGLGARYNIVNLTAPAAGLPCGAGPMDWAALAINAVEVTWSFAEETTQLRVANTFFMLEEYSALKDRLEHNLFVQRELNLSQQIYDCQIQAPAAQDPTTRAPFTTTAWPSTPPPTTAGPTTGPTTPPPTTPGPTTGAPTTPPPGGGTTAGPTTPGPTTPGPTTPGPGGGSTTPGPTTPGPTTPGPTTPEATTTAAPTTTPGPACGGLLDCSGYTYHSDITVDRIRYLQGEDDSCVQDGTYTYSGTVTWTYNSGDETWHAAMSGQSTDDPMPGAQVWFGALSCQAWDSGGGVMKTEYRFTVHIQSALSNDSQLYVFHPPNNADCPDGTYGGSIPPCPPASCPSTVDCSDWPSSQSVY